MTWSLFALHCHDYSLSRQCFSVKHFFKIFYPKSICSTKYYIASKIPPFCCTHHHSCTISNTYFGQLLSCIHKHTSTVVNSLKRLEITNFGWAGHSFVEAWIEGITRYSQLEHFSAKYDGKKISTELTASLLRSHPNQHRLTTLGLFGNEGIDQSTLELIHILFSLRRFRLNISHRLLFSLSSMNLSHRWKRDRKEWGGRVSQGIPNDSLFELVNLWNEYLKWIISSFSFFLLRIILTIGNSSPLSHLWSSLNSIRNID